MTRAILYCLICLLIVAPIAAQGQIPVDPGQFNSINKQEGPFACGLISLLTGCGPAGALTASELILGVIDILLAIVGLVSVLFVIIGGFRYVTAHSNEERAADAKKTILNALIGIGLVIMSFVIVRILSNALAYGRI